MGIISKIFSLIGTIIAITWFLSLLGIEIDWKKHLKEFFRTEEKPLNNKQELNKIRAEIDKAKTKEEKWPI